MSRLKLVDSFGRKIDYLRVSVTDRCNFNCIYCASISEIKRLTHSEILTYEEILHTVKIAVGLGISKVRITGGEPLIRKGLCSFLEKLCIIPGLEDISITTNGALLSEKAASIKKSGVKRINISLDTLDKKKFKKITGKNLFSKVWQGIEACIKNGFDPIKLNVVALNHINEQEIAKIAALTFDYPFDIRFIEYMNIGNTICNTQKPILTPEIKKIVSSLGEIIPVEKQKHLMLQSGPAQNFKIKGAEGQIGFISPVSNHFCKTCSRIRLTASGGIRPCLLSDTQIDIKDLLRQKAPDNQIAEAFLKAARIKWEGHRLNSANYKVNRQMSAIGG